LQHTQNHNSSIMQLGKDKAARLAFLQSMSILTSCAADSETNIVDSMKSIQTLLQFGIDNSNSSSSKSESQHLPSHPTMTCNTLPIGKFITIVYPTLYKSIGNYIMRRVWDFEWQNGSPKQGSTERTGINVLPGFGSLKVDLDSQVRFCTSPHRSLQSDQGL
jgi:hypothetical protein